jgi:predicted porin
MGQFTVGVDKKKSKGIYSTTAAENNAERDQMTYGLAYAITPTLTLGASYAKNEIKAVTTAVADEKAKTVALGYNLGPVVAEVQYGTFDNAKGVNGADSEVVFARFITKF